MGHTQATISSRQVHRLDSNSHFCSNNKKNSPHVKYNNKVWTETWSKKKYLLDSHKIPKIVMSEHAK